MRIPTPACCALCDVSVDAANMSDHLRTLHQVAPGERTIADVPVDRGTSLHLTSGRAERDEEMVGVGAV